MKVLFLSTWFPHPPDNGSKLRVQYLLRGLAEHHQVTLLSFAFTTARPDAPGDLANKCQDIQVVPVDPFLVNQAGALRTFLIIPDHHNARLLALHDTALGVEVGAALI